MIIRHRHPRRSVMLNMKTIIKRHSSDDRLSLRGDETVTVERIVNVFN